MSNDILSSKIELLQEQIDNLEKSGHFTEKEIDKLVYPLCKELDSLKGQLKTSSIESEINSDLTATESNLENRNIETLWDVLDGWVNPVCDIEVTDAEILTANSITA